MQIASLFAKDINRPINNVIEVNQDDTETMKQELAEYVVTTELSRHFSDFYDVYEHSLNVPTKNIGVWISGFYGSGKSHFLKMLSYLLENRIVDSVPTIDYFKGKIKDPMVEAKLERSTTVPTEVILFNIAQHNKWNSGHEGRTALTKTIASVFYDHQGFYGRSLKIARLERHLKRIGRLEDFESAFLRINGADWISSREGSGFFEDDIVEALQEAAGMSEVAARNWFASTEDDEISPDQLTDEIAEYVKDKAAENGGEFRLVLAIDEVGQFVGSDVALLLDLQTIVERLGTKCAGNVWVMVTSQEAIDDITNVASQNFSKIQDRFSTRLSMSSSSVDEVIKCRILEKTDAARAVLKDEFNSQASILRNLYTFEDCPSDLKGFEGEEDFQASYPFVNYQFKLMPSILDEIRKHSYANNNLSTGERSMLSGFQGAAKLVQEDGLSTVVPLWRFYDVISKTFDHGIVQVFSRAEEAARKTEGLTPRDVEVLKTLYLIRYISDIKPSVNNITILMIDDMNADKVVLREEVKDSLDRLVGQNYVGRSGDRYSFLTDEEQDVAREIADIEIDPSEVTEQIKKIIFDGIFTKKKFPWGKSDFAIDRYVDDTLHGTLQGGMKLNVITAANGEFIGMDTSNMILRSSGQALVKLADARYYEDLRNAAKIRRYGRTRSSELSESKKAILAAKQKEAAANEREAQELIEDAIVDAFVAVNGQPLQTKTNKASDVLEAALKELVTATFTKADYITQTIDGHNDLLKILAGGGVQGAFDEMGGSSEPAIKDMQNYLESLRSLLQEPSMDDIQRHYQGKPYGWREYDIAGVVAALLAAGVAQAKIGGVVVNPRDVEGRNRIVANLTGKGASSMSISLREKIDEKKLQRARKILRELDSSLVIPDDGDDLIIAIRQNLADKKNWAVTLINNEYEKRAYPGRDIVEQGVSVFSDVLAYGADDRALLDAFVKAENSLLDWGEDIEDVRSFFPNQQRIFDEAHELLESMGVEATYLEANVQAQEAMQAIREILKDAKPYREIPKLSPKIDELKKAYDKVLMTGKHEALDLMDSTIAEIEAYASDLNVDAASVIAQAKEELARKKSQVHEATSRTMLDIMCMQLGTWRKNQLAKIDALIVKAKPPVGGGEVPPAQPAVKTIERSRLCPSKMLRSEQEIDAYVDQIRAMLLDALSDADSVSIR